MNQLISAGGKEVRVVGGVVRMARLHGDEFRFLDNPEPVLEDLKKCGVRVDLFTFMQRLSDTTPKFPYSMELHNLAVLPISTFDHWFTKQIRFAPRGRIRTAEKKGVTVREVPFDDALVKGIWEIYNECPVRNGRPFRHYGIDLPTAHKVEATHLSNSIFIGAFLEGKLVGFVKLVFDDTRTQASLMNIISMVQHQEKCPTNALIAQSVRSCAERSISSLLYQQFYYRNKRPDGLTKFKEVNGFQSVDVPRYYVPLSPLGSMAFKLGIHHGYASFIPEPVAAKLREIRKAWLNRKVPRTEGQPVQGKGQCQESSPC